MQFEKEFFRRRQGRDFVPIPQYEPTPDLIANMVGFRKGEIEGISDVVERVLR